MAISSIDTSQVLTERFFQLYPGEVAGHLNELLLDDVLRLLQSMPILISEKVFLRLNPDMAARLIEQMDNDFFLSLYTNIDLVQGAILLSRLDEKTIKDRLALLPKNLAKEYQELMGYPPDSAGYIMDPRVLTFTPHDTIEKALERIRAVGDRRIIDICVIDEEGVLVGLVPLQNIAVAQPTQRLEELIQREPITVNMMDPREDVVKLLEDRKLASLPVVNLDRKLLGIIRYDALVTAAQEEVSQDMQAMFGAGRDERALSKVSFAIRKRLPWLEINLATAFLAASVVGLFEGTIAKFTALAVFLPVVAGQSGNTGSQALAVTMRGLALREIRTRHWFRVSRKEMMVGLLNGIMVAITTSLVVYIWMSSAGLAVIIGTAMVFSMVIAGFSGALIPIILQAFGQDPAQSSSIILTTVTDVVGFMSFLGLATLLANVLPIA
jgi:magnesium transporter